MNIKDEINDTVVRVIGIPFFGLLIPSATGLVDSESMGAWQLVSSYAWFILGAGIIWQGNRYLLFRFINKGDWVSSPAKRLGIIVGTNILYTIGVSLLLLCAWFIVMSCSWYWVSGFVFKWTSIWITVAIILVCVLFVTSAYELIYQVKLKENQRLKAEQLESAKILAELEALKSHVDPHFMFNSLNLVSYLIDIDPKRARKFVDDLSEVYRYILQSKNKDLVLLGDEMDFTRKYIELLELRFEESLSVELSVNKKQEYKFLVPPVSIMMAVENAVKHNEASQQNKLFIKITQQNNSLTIQNNLAVKKNIRDSSKTGLINLEERYKQITGASIKVLKTDTEFSLTLPLLPLTAS